MSAHLDYLIAFPWQTYEVVTIITPILQVRNTSIAQSHIAGKCQSQEQNQVPLTTLFTIASHCPWVSVSF